VLKNDHKKELLFLANSASAGRTRSSHDSPETKKKPFFFIDRPSARKWHGLFGIPEVSKTGKDFQQMFFVFPSV